MTRLVLDMPVSPIIDEATRREFLSVPSC